MAIVASLVAQVSDIRQIGVCNGTIFFVVPFATLTGDPVGDALIAHDNGGFVSLQIFCEMIIFVGGCFFIASRYAQVGMT